ncbi:MAG: hypothetical protein EOO01_24625 [Chitinophagaceae bacterium]|nr:MAG: hypothetical protein EOO01_24625 [Chitinophagaceae bacterium]
MFKAGAIKKIFIHLLGWVLFLQMVNLCIDTPIIQNAATTRIESTTPGVHEIETLYELFATTMLEHTLPDSGDKGIDKDLQIFDIVCQRIPETLPMIPDVTPEHATYKQKDFMTYFPRLPSPPPDAV